VIDPKGQLSVILQGDTPDHFHHASDVIVIGCQSP
jgi:hypothetical protein